MKSFIIKAVGFILLLCAVGIWLLCCTRKDAEITEGTVLSKEFRPANTYFKTERRTTTRVRNGNTISIPRINTYQVSSPDRWVIFVATNEHDGTCDTVDFFVRKAVYDTVAIGSRFAFDTTMGTFDEPREKVK